MEMSGAMSQASVVPNLCMAWLGQLRVEAKCRYAGLNEL